MYSPPTPCSQCVVAKVRLRALGIGFEQVIVDDAKAEALKREGHASFPVVVVDLGDGASWSFSGLPRQVDLDQLKELYDSAAAAA